jgi:hypothetical protein
MNRKPFATAMADSAVQKIATHTSIILLTSTPKEFATFMQA